MADLLTAVGRTSDAATWRANAANETTQIQNTFFNASDGMFHAATGQCNQIDVWGSAFAVQLGVATPTQALSVANYLNNNYSAMVINGQVRQIPAPNYWQVALTAQNTDQDGTYWAVGTGMFAKALATVNPAKSQQTLLDMINWCKTNGAMPEYCVNSGAAGAGRIVRAALPLEQMKQYMLTAEPTLRSTGGTLKTAGDVALAANGGTAFAENVLPGYTQHTIAHLNDGVYGNGNSWIADSQASFAGVAFNQAYTISSLAFGRDNTGAYADRYMGTYIFQYTTTPNPNAGTPDADWTSFGAFYLDSVFPNTTNNYRHVYAFNPISGVTGVRIEVDAAAPGSTNYICLDELEVYSALPGDANGDGNVDVNDLTIVLSNFGQSGMTWSQGEFTGSGTVDINDLTVLLSNFGGAAAGITAVPEPATIVLISAVRLACSCPPAGGENAGLRPRSQVAAWRKTAAAAEKRVLTSICSSRLHWMLCRDSSSSRTGQANDGVLSIQRPRVSYPSFPYVQSLPYRQAEAAGLR